MSYIETRAPAYHDRILHHLTGSLKFPHRIHNLLLPLRRHPLEAINTHHKRHSRMRKGRVVYKSGSGRSLAAQT
jgi:hypothetical protein